MFHSWIPHAHYKNVASCPLDRYFSMGYRLALLDIDNTLAVHGSDHTAQYAKEQFQRFRDSGFVIYILSNAKKVRAESFARSLDPLIPVIGNAGKPGVKGIKRAIQESGIAKNKTLLFGDQLFTDVWSANRAGIPAVLVDRITAKEPWYIHLKRFFEKIVRFLTKSGGYYDRIPEVMKTDEPDN